MAGPEGGLSYGDSFLEPEDVALLDGPYWLNDAVIGFAMALFETAKFSHLAKTTLFVVPSVVQMMSLLSTPEELGAIFGALAIGSKELVFLPLNDHGDAESRGGSHWSLLVYHAGRGRYTLLDSMPSIDMQRRAELLATRLRDAFDLGAGAGAEGLVRVHKGKCPRQQNGFDCGVYAIAFVQQLAVTGFDVEALAEITPEWITKLRAELLAEIRRLQAA